MADNRSDYEIRISTIASGDGAKQAAEGLKQVTGAASGATPAVGALDQSFEKLKRRDIKAIFRDAAHLIPELGSLMLFLRNPIAGIIGAFAALALAVRHAYAELAKAEQASLGLSQLARGASETQTHLAAAQVSAADFATALQNIIERAPTAEEKLGELNQQIDQETENTKKLLTATAELAKLRIEADASLTDEEKAKRKGGIDVASGRQLTEVDLRAQAAKLSAKEGAARALPDQIAAATAKAEADRQALKAEKDSASAAKKADDEDKKTLETRLSELMGTADKPGLIAGLQGKAQRVQPTLSDLTGAGQIERAVIAAGEPARQKAEAELQKARDEAAKINERLGILPGRETTRSGAVAAAAAAASEAQAKTLEEQHRKFGIEIPRERAALQKQVDFQRGIRSFSGGLDATRITTEELPGDKTGRGPRSIPIGSTHFGGSGIPSNTGGLENILSENEALRARNAAFKASLQEDKTAREEQHKILDKIVAGQKQANSRHARELDHAQ